MVDPDSPELTPEVVDALRRKPKTPLGQHYGEHIAKRIEAEDPQIGHSDQRTPTVRERMIEAEELGNLQSIIDLQPKIDETRD